LASGMARRVGDHAFNRRDDELADTKRALLGAP
jgi:hypothetical protein